MLSSSGEAAYHNFQLLLGGIAYNVLAVCDVFLRPIKKPRGGFRAQKNVGGVGRGNGAQRNDLAARNPRSDLRERRRIRSCYTT
jgi:hypothetical protein